jgi:hypothetical protein
VFSFIVRVGLCIIFEPRYFLLIGSLIWRESLLKKFNDESTINGMKIK